MLVNNMRLCAVNIINSIMYYFQNVLVGLELVTFLRCEKFRAFCLTIYYDTFALFFNSIHTNTNVKRMSI